MNICEIRTDGNIVDPLTKPLPQPKYESQTRALGLKHMGEWLYLCTIFLKLVTNVLIFGYVCLYLQINMIVLI